MKTSERTVKRLGEIITGDKGILPYRGGPKLVSFFNECGTNHNIKDFSHPAANNKLPLLRWSTTRETGTVGRYYSW